MKRKKIGLIIVLIFIGAICFGISRLVQNPEQYQKKNDDIAVVIDCTKFSRISKDELKKELGDPQKEEIWNNDTSKGNFPMVIYTYNFEGFYGEFILYEDEVVKLHLFNNSQWKVEGANSDNIFAMFGIILGENAKQTVNTGTTHKFSPVSDKVAEVEFYNYNKDSKTFDTVYVTYNLNYFD